MTSRNSRRFSSAAEKLVRLLHMTREEGMRRDGMTHYFKVFRMGDDVCATCGKPRAEHPKRNGT